MLQGSVGSSNLRIVNSHADGSALSFVVEPGNPPFKVNSPNKVTSLNADRVDGFHGKDLFKDSRVLFASITELGTVATGRAISASNKKKGHYEVVFPRSTYGCTGTATAGLAKTNGGDVALSVSFAIAMGGTFAGRTDSVKVTIWRPNDILNTPRDSAFHLIIICPEKELQPPGN